MSRKVWIFIAICLTLYTVSAWIIAAKVIFDFLFMLGMWATS